MPGVTAPDGGSRQGVWLRAILAALVLGAAVGAAAVLVWHYDVNVTAAVAAVVTALAGLAGGLAYDTQRDPLATIFFQIRGYV
jgi:hypothetical protein